MDPSASLIVMPDSPEAEAMVLRDQMDAAIYGLREGRGDPDRARVLASRARRLAMFVDPGDQPALLERAHRLDGLARARAPRPEAPEPTRPTRPARHVPATAVSPALAPVLRRLPEGARTARR